jgi:glycine/serine hydroxymethyltransferase
MRVIGGLIGRTLRAREDEAAISVVRGEVRDLTAAFPPYPTLGGE